MAERVNQQVGATPVETTDRGLFDFKNKDAEGKPIKEETLASEFDQRDQVSDPVEAEYQDELEKKYGATPEEAEYKDEEKKHGAIPVETTDHSLFDLIQNDSENKKPVTEETFAPEIDRKAPVSEQAEYKEGDDEEKKQRQPGHKDEVAEDTHVPVKKPHVQEVVYSELKKPHVQEEVYSEPPQTEEDPEKKSFLDKIKEKLPGHNKTNDSHDEAVPVSVEPVVK